MDRNPPVVMIFFGLLLTVSVLMAVKLAVDRPIPPTNISQTDDNAEPQPQPVPDVPLTYKKDIALVVGVDTYTDLDKARFPDLESAAEHSVPLVAGALKQLGFDEVVTLLNSEARKESVLAKIRELGQETGTGNRFVFYFLGHGSRSQDKPVILPSDAMETSDQNDISREELAQAIGSVNAIHRTVLLDSCWSGTMIASQTASAPRANRLLSMYYSRPKLAQGEHPQSGKADFQFATNDVHSGALPTCYFTASGEEPAFASEFNGEMYGVFSHALVEHLKPKTTQTWADLKKDVEEDVVQKTDATQHPRLSSGYEEKAIFEGGKEKSS